MAGILVILAGISVRAAEPDPKSGFFPKIDIRDLPFILIPEVGTDPDTGTTLGLMPVFLTTDEQRRIRRIIAPDVTVNPNFGLGARGRVFGYPSEDTHWSVVGGLKQRVERNFGAAYATGLTCRTIGHCRFRLSTTLHRSEFVLGKHRAAPPGA